MDLLIVVRVRLQLQAVECDALGTDGDLGQIGPNLCVESVFIHTQEPRGVPESDQPSVNHESHVLPRRPIWGFADSRSQIVIEVGSKISNRS